MYKIRNLAIIQRMPEDIRKSSKTHFPRCPMPEEVCPKRSLETFFRGIYPDEVSIILLILQTSIPHHKKHYTQLSIQNVHIAVFTQYFNPRTPRGGWVPPPWRFSPVTFLMIPTAKIASSYLILGMGDTFWHMWHHLDAVTWHMSWRHMYMTVVKIHCFYHCL